MVTLIAMALTALHLVHILAEVERLQLPTGA